MVKIAVARILAGLLGKKMYAMGAALAIGLRKGLLDAGVEVRHGESGPTTVIRARRGVILGSGGFERNLEMREKYLPAPTSVEWTTGAFSNTGGGILAGIAAGADTDLMDESWWGPTIPFPGRPWFALAERNLPGSIIVNSAGKRFMNEALPYVEAVHEIYKGQETGISHVPAWLVFDQRYRNLPYVAVLHPDLIPPH